MTETDEPDASTSIDVHQHLWPAEFIDALRARTEGPMLRDWTLHTDYEAPFLLTPADHDPARRRRLDPDRGQVLLSLSTPIGVEALPPEQSAPLLRAWHDGLLGLAEGSRHFFTGWAAVSSVEPDLAELTRLFTDHPTVFRGLQLPATSFADPSAVEALAPILQLCERFDRPVLVHPGPVPDGGQADRGLPAWWPAVVSYPNQLQVAWWAWRTVGRSVAPELRICFAAGAGLAPAQHERFTARSGEPFVVDPGVFVDTSSYRRQGVDALVRALGIDAPVLASDRPYAEPTDPQLGEAAWNALAVNNPRRLLHAATNNPEGSAR